MVEIEADGRIYTDYIDERGNRHVALVSEGLRCGTGHLFIEKFLRDDGSGGKMCPHCESIDVYPYRLLTPQDVPEEVLNRFGIEIDSSGLEFEYDTLRT